MTGAPRDLIVTRASLIKAKPPPICDACAKSMRWHGSTKGWGCPTASDNPACRSSLYRPKRNPNDSWPYDERYPERVTGLE
jgi:hypothetical protein